MAHIDVFKGWADTIRGDVDAYKALLEAPGADDDARKLAAAALTYLVSRMDLIPDWNEGIGVIDDVMILRVVAQLTRTHDRGVLPATAVASLQRLADESAAIVKFIGAPVYNKLEAYCVRLTDQSVRGRTPTQLVADAEIRNALYLEIDEELKKHGPITIADPADAELRLKAYLTHKLQ